MTHACAVLGMLNAPDRADPGHGFRFRMLRRYLAYRPDESARMARLLDLVRAHAPGRGSKHLLMLSAARIRHDWCSMI